MNDKLEKEIIIAEDDKTKLKKLSKKNQKLVSFFPGKSCAKILSIEEIRAHNEGFEFNKSKYIRDLIMLGWSLWTKTKLHVKKDENTSNTEN